ncbi:DUF6103 family protein [Tissierella creatinophila]|uniref:Uncharacterized protein n=1 Tax=Tissierella creatinophila DSM 6911 TaxID=1123403 RepID=A0A1U7M473_TISCR|nr:DUF6103 family protein [Tissierella creatinophila]OLS01998.1 hypothetical protein TICRE_21400 [Tissierella creatinophila DSM 6911]
MSAPNEKTLLKVSFPNEKLEALRFYMGEKELTVEGELQKYVDSIYQKYVPAPTRRYLDRNDNGEELQAEITIVNNEIISENTKNDTSKGRRKATKSQEIEGQVVNEPVEDGEVVEQVQEENQGMVMTM